MATDRPHRRLPLRDLITHAEKSSRTVVEHLQSEVLAQIAEFRELSRPVRRKSHYPRLVALQNALNNLQTVNTDMQTLASDLHSQLEEIRERAKREPMNRM